MTARLLPALVLLAACGGATHRPGGEPAMRPTPWTLTYSDGAANAYTFTRAWSGGEVAFVYDPVTPEQSSTGHYSGGDPVKKNLPGDDPRIEELWRRVEALGADPAIAVPDRAKGTGAFFLLTPAGERRFIIEMGPAHDDFNLFIGEFRRTSP